MIIIRNDVKTNFRIESVINIWKSLPFKYIIQR